MSSDIVNGVDLARLPDVILGRHAEWVELNRLAWRLGARNVRTTRGRRHMDCGFGATHNYLWVWDSCFMSMFTRYGGGQFPGVESIDIFYDCQRDDGYISMCYDMDTGEEPWADRINPPLFAWAEWEHYRVTGDASRFARAIPHIERLMDWIDANRRTEPHRRASATDGVDMGSGESASQYQLYWFEDGGSSGMDDSPRTPRNPGAGRFFDWIDLSCQVALSFRMLGRMHGVLGNAQRAAHWESRAVELGELINVELWCERTAFYHDRMLPRNFVAHKTAAGFWPMLAGICPPERVEHLVRHLEDEREFNRPTPVPTLSADDLNYSPDGVYWLGGVWPPTNYMIVRGLECAGRHELAHRIAVRYLEAMTSTYREVEPHTLWECYCPEGNRHGLTAYSHEPVRGDFVGWAGIGPIAMLIEQVVGIEVDTSRGAVTWRVRLTEEHGVRRLPACGGVADFRCDERTGAAAPAAISVCSDVPFRLHVECAGRVTDVDIPPGKAVEIRG